jgi:hypothetical protein
MVFRGALKLVRHLRRAAIYKDHDRSQTQGNATQFSRSSQYEPEQSLILRNLILHFRWVIDNDRTIPALIKRRLFISGVFTYQHD